MLAPSVTKSHYVLRKALTALRIQQDKASSECLTNQFTFYPALQKLKDQLLFCSCSGLPPKNAWLNWYSPCTDTQCSRSPVLMSPVTEGVHWHSRATLGNKAKSLHFVLLHNLVSFIFTSRQLWIFLHLSAPQECC